MAQETKKENTQPKPKVVTKEEAAIVKQIDQDKKKKVANRENIQK